MRSTSRFALLAALLAGVSACTIELIDQDDDDHNVVLDGGGAPDAGSIDGGAFQCGDGIFQPQAGEACDDANNVSGDGCSSDCSSTEVCGNGVLDNSGVLGVREVCDDGNNVSGDGCSADCMSNETCGNAVVDPGEQCDDGNLLSGDGCSSGCQLENSTCGNGVVNLFEECDNGQPGVNTATCDADCTLPLCGDGVANFPAGEQCDTAGSTASCDADCTAAVCGDGLVNPAAGEECDDGNLNNADACPNNCQVP